MKNSSFHLSLPVSLSVNQSILACVEAALVTRDPGLSLKTYRELDIYQGLYRLSATQVSQTLKLHSNMGSCIVIRCHVCVFGPYAENDVVVK